MVLLEVLALLQLPFWVGRHVWKLFTLTLAKGDYVTQQSPMHHPLETIVASDCCNTTAMVPRWFHLGDVSQVSPLFPIHTI
jgi:hypothetical protein